jgi:hypothetical protein
MLRRRPTTPARIATLASAALASAVMGAAASAGEPAGGGPAPSGGDAPVSLIEGRGFLSVGTFANSTALDIRLDPSTSLPGTEIDWDQRFGLEHSKRFRLDGLWRFTPKHHLRVLYTDYSQTDSATLASEIQWGDDLFPVNAQVTGTLGFEVIEAAYEYAFVTSDRAEIAGSVGLHYTTLEARLAATVTSPTTGTRSIGGPRSVDAPLPVVGLRGMWRIGDQVYLDAQAQYFSLAIDDIKGSLYNYRAALIWQPTRRVGIGAGYDAFGVDVELRQDDFRGKVDWVYRGPQVFVTVAF